jgi:hypothetical protein
MKDLNIFGLCWNLRLVLELWDTYLERFWFLLEDFFEDYYYNTWKKKFKLILKIVFVFFSLCFSKP